MAKLWRLFLLTVITCFLTAASAYAQVITYPVPEGDIRLNTDYTVRVRDAESQEWKDVAVYGAMVNYDANFSNISRDMAVSYFDMSGEVVVQVTSNKAGNHTFQVRPTTAVDFTQQGNTIEFTLTQPEKLSVEVDGNIKTNLLLYANPIENYRLMEDTRNVIYLGPGLHTVENCKYIDSDYKIHVPSDTILYIAGGAVVRASVVFWYAENSAVWGHGMLDFDPYQRPDGQFDKEPYQRGVIVECSNDIVIDGIIAKNPCYYSVAGYEANNVLIKNFKSNSMGIWADGIDFICSNNITVDDCFLRTSDDAFAIYNSRYDFTGSSSNWTIKNSTFWSDVAHAIHIGCHGSQNANNREVIENVKFENIDILGSAPDNGGGTYSGAIGINCGDENIIRDITFEDIRVDEIKGELLHLMNHRMIGVSKQPGYELSNITFKNLSYNGDIYAKSPISGNTAERSLDGLRIENFTINGNVVKNFDIFNIGNHVYNFVLVDDKGTEYRP